MLPLPPAVSAHRLGARCSRLAAGTAVAGILLAALATPGRAVDSGLTLTLSTRWNAPGRLGAWTAYVVGVRNDSGATFTGEARLVRNPSSVGTYPPFQSVPEYRVPLSVPAAAERTVPVYVIEPPGGYHAELHDQQGGLVARAGLQSAPPASAAIAVLSDVTQAGQRIDASLRALTGLGLAVSQFASAQAFPTSAVYLSGLNGVVVDQFSAAALSPAQVRALEDFVGLGGALVLVGGASWRRVLQPLPEELLPLRPADVASAPLAPMAELAGLASPAVVQVVTGQVAPWARASVTSPAGEPLIVEGRHGAGRIVTLTFDPLAQPLDTQLDMAALSWSQAIARAVGGTQAGVQTSGPFAPPFPGVGLRGWGPGSWSAPVGSLDQVLRALPAPSPPFGLLALLLAGYGLLVTVLSYVVLRRIGRRGLLWLIAPLLAVAFTAGSYWVGFGTRAADYQATGLQTLRLGPDGVVETYTFDAILTPRPGDISLTVPADSLVSTAVATSGPVGQADREAVITSGPRPEVLLTNVPVWDVRPVTTLDVTRDLPPGTGPALAVEAVLSVEHGRIRGQVTNHTARTLRDIQLVTGSGKATALVPALAPGATAAVDAALPAGPPGFAVGKGGLVVGPIPQPGLQSSTVTLAASQVVGRPSDLALVATTDPVGTVRVNGTPLTGSFRALVDLPVVLESADSLSGIEPQAHLVSGFAGARPGALDAYEIELPPGLTGRVGLAATAFGPQGTVPVDVYDWNLGSWRTVSLSSAFPGQVAPAVPLTAGETAAGVVRLRTHPSRGVPIVLSATTLP